MTRWPDFQRELRSGEEAEVDALLTLSFGGPEEVAVVHRLRADRAMAGEQVMAADGAIIAYAALSRMIDPKGWLCLGPVAVHPDWQGRGLGRRMVGMIVEWARISGVYVVVVGEGKFYRSAGFSALRAARLRAEFPVANLLLAGPGGDFPDRKLVCPRAFEPS